MQKLAIIGTTCAMNLQPLGGGKYDRNPSDLLLALKKRGYTVIVITTRASLVEEDKLWSHLADHLFFPVGSTVGADARSPAYIRPWEMVFQEFNLTLPINPRDWLDYKQAASRQGIITGIYDVPDLETFLHG